MISPLSAPVLVPNASRVPRVAAWRADDASVHLAYRGLWSLARSVREIRLGYALWDPDHGVLFHRHPRTGLGLAQLQALYADHPAARAVDERRQALTESCPVYLPTGALCAVIPHEAAVTLVDRGWAAWRDPRQKTAGLWVSPTICSASSGAVSVSPAPPQGFPVDWATRHAPDPADVMAHGARRLAADRAAALALAAWFHVPVPTASAEEGHYHVACAAVIARHHIQGEARPDPDAASAAVARWAMAVRAGQDPHQAFLQAFSRSPAGGPAVI